MAVFLKEEEISIQAEERPCEDRELMAISKANRKASEETNPAVTPQSQTSSLQHCGKVNLFV